MRDLYMQSSGSRLFVEKLKTHPDIKMVSANEKKVNKEVSILILGPCKGIPEFSTNSIHQGKYHISEPH